MLFASFMLFFFNDTATTEIYTLSLHDALPISNESSSPRNAFWPSRLRLRCVCMPDPFSPSSGLGMNVADRKSTRLNSSHANISYAVFCLKKKKTNYFKLMLVEDD